MIGQTHTTVFSVESALEMVSTVATTHLPKYSRQGGKIGTGVPLNEGTNIPIKLS